MSFLADIRISRPFGKDRGPRTRPRKLIRSVAVSEARRQGTAKRGMLQLLMRVFRGKAE